YRVPFYATAVLTFVAFGLVIALVKEQRLIPSAVARKQKLSVTLALLLRSGGLLPLFFVLLFATFAVSTVQPVVTLFVQELVGNGPTVATMAGFAFSVTGVADVIASPFLGKRSDVIGYRKVLLIAIAGAALATLPQAFAGNYYAFVAERFGVGCFIGGILPTANALVGRMVPGSQRGTVYGMTASATFLGNSLGPLTGGAIAAVISIRFVFVVTAALLVATWVWVYFTVPEYTDAGGLQPPPRRFRSR
ncbi:MAG: MFS transporter, partial [Acetobacteraceae bacterium]